MVSFQRLFVRGGSEYEQFKTSGYHVVPGSDRFNGELTVEALQAYIAGRQEPPAPPPPPPTSDEAVYLHSILGVSENIYQDYHCCETHLWVEAIQKDEFVHRLELFVEPILNTVGAGPDCLSEARLSTKPDFGFLYRAVPEAKMVILLAPFRGEPPRNEVEEKYGDLIAEGPLDQETALKKSKRAYPHELLLNQDAWFQVERDKEGNMALSLEEVAVLDSAKNGGYPLFINGRAGSGKSTILQYPFSEYLYHHLSTNNLTTPPIYFACNDELLSRAMFSVRNLVAARRSARPTAQGRNEPLATESLAAFFKNFHRWLHGFAPQEMFPWSSLVDYGRFKKWWEARFAKDPSSRRLFDADISWHVIRTYIKGTSSEGFLDPDDYKEIPSKQKSVRPETYQVVYDKVWKRYQEHQAELGLWDHQDLARYVLEHDLLEAKHPVVFCDEAQDFTRIELEMLDRHCLFNARHLEGYELPRVRIAFAGDPFQTLNPTGFRWKATKAFFTEKFLKCQEGQESGINYRELSYNYRSNRNIVQFCNSLQIVRSSVFDIPEIRPQLPWCDEKDSPNVVYFDKDDLGVLRELQRQSEIRIIVPCEEGMETEWTRQSALAEFVETDEAGVPKNVVSASRVKGLEFPRVVLFGFGGACPSVLRKAIKGSTSHLEGDQAIEPQYFMNRLYVASSRPRKRLFIIDSAEDISTFWNEIFAYQYQRLEENRCAEEWSQFCGRIIKGSVDSWDADQENPRETAEELEKEGRLRKDRILLRQAAQSYESAGLHIQAKQCRAEALEIEEEYIDAAKIWRDLNQFQRSVKAACQSGDSGYRFIAELAEEHSVVSGFLEYRIAQFLQKSDTFNAGVTLLNDLQETLSGSDDSLRRAILTQSSWAQAICECLDKLLANDIAETGLWSLINTSIGALAREGVKVRTDIRGEVAYRSGLLREAYGHWSAVASESKPRVDQKFLRAKVASLQFPESLECAGELLARFRSKEDAEKVIELIHTEGEEKLLGLHYEIVARAHLQLGDLSEAIQALESVRDVNLV